MIANDIAACHAQFTANEVRCLDAISAFIYGGNANIAIILSRARFLDIAHTAMNLDAKARYFCAKISAISFG